MSVADRRLFYNADRSALVDECDPAAAFLAVTPGNEIPDGFDEPKVKQAPKPADKSTRSPANKSKG